MIVVVALLSGRSAVVLAHRTLPPVSRFQRSPGTTLNFLDLAAAEDSIGTLAAARRHRMSSGKSSCSEKMKSRRQRQSDARRRHWQAAQLAGGRRDLAVAPDIKADVGWVVSGPESV